MANEVYYATGSRKSSAARVFLKKGTGKIKINGLGYSEYLKTKIEQSKIQQAFLITNTKDQFDLNITVKGGGVTGQSEAIRHGIAHALITFDPELRPDLKKAGYLTRDARKVERKKYGLRKARRSPQFSKR